MEDNEFEEVTIISHTDQGATILPQRTAERLMKDIRLEVTQKISQTENIKMGLLKIRSSPVPTLLDIIKDKVFRYLHEGKGLGNLLVWPISSSGKSPKISDDAKLYFSTISMCFDLSLCVTNT